MPAGAPKGNKNSSQSNRLWTDTIRRALVQSDAKKLRAIADKLVEMAEEGNIMAIKEIGDRMDGKAAQMILGPGEDGEHTVNASVTVNFVKSKPSKK